MPPPRESVYPFASATGAPSNEFLYQLETCIEHTAAAADSLQESLRRFEPGVRDLPRLSKVLVNKHHFLVLPQPQVQAHQSAISTSLAPQIETLISKADALISSQAARVSNLEERLQILQSRHAQAAARSAPPASAPVVKENETNEDQGAEGDEPSYLEDLAMKELSVPQRRKVMMLRTKRAKLEKERAELEG